MDDGLASGLDGMNGATRVRSLLPTGFKAMKRNELQRLCVLKGFKAKGKNKDMVSALEASMCSDMAATGGGSAAENGVDGIALDFKSLTRKELQQLCKQNKLRANDKAVNMAVALEARFRCSAVAVAGGMNAALDAFRFSAWVMSDGGSAAEDDDEEVEDDEG